MEHLRILFCANGYNVWGEKLIFYERNGSVALLFASNGVSLLANTKVKVGNIHNTEVF
jgi:hypothetical protein